MHEIPFPKKDAMIPIQRWKLFFQHMKEIAGEGFVFNMPGGEPLLHPDVFDIIKIASTNGLKPLLSTNAFLINKQIADKLIKNGLFGVTISLDSSIPDVHDQIRGVRESFDKVEQAIRYLDFHSKIYNAKVSIGIQSVIQMSNLDNIPDLVQYVENNPLIERINLNLLMRPNNSKEDKEWYKNEFKELWPDDSDKVDQIIDELVELKAKNKVQKLLNTITQLKSYKEYFRDPKKTPKLLSCNYDKAICTNSSGDIHLCFHYDKIGNINTDRLIDVWNSKQAKTVREKIKNCHVTDCWFRLNCLYSD